MKKSELKDIIRECMSELNEKVKPGYEHTIKGYEKRVKQLEDEGITRSDAQSITDVEVQNGKYKKWKLKESTMNKSELKDIVRECMSELDEAKKKSGGIPLECMECGKKFKKKITAGTVDVKCPKCGGYDVDIA